MEYPFKPDITCHGTHHCLSNSTPLGPPHTWHHFRLLQNILNWNRNTQHWIYIWVKENSITRQNKNTRVDCFLLTQGNLTLLDKFLWFLIDNKQCHTEIRVSYFFSMYKFSIIYKKVAITPTYVICRHPDNVIPYP